MKSLIKYIYEGNTAHKLANYAKKYYEKWAGDLKDVQTKYENSIKDKELMQKDYEKYLDVQFKLMDEFNNKCNELVDNEEVATSAFLYQIKMLKDSQTNLFGNVIKNIKHSIDVAKEDDVDSSKQVSEYVKTTLEKTLEGMEKGVNGLNEVLKNHRNNKDISSFKLSDEEIAAFVNKYKLVGIKYTDKFELYDKNAIVDLFKKRVKEFIESKK